MPAGSQQPSAALPTKQLLVGQAAGGLLAGLLWLLGTWVGEFGATILQAGLIEVGLVVTIALVGTLIITPWKVRPIGTWAIVLITTSLVRLVVITGLTLVLYSAAQMAPKALVVSAFMTILAILIIETLVAARFMSQHATAKV